MRCAVFGRKWRFFHFPEDKVVVKQWIHFCRRTHKINVKNACICEVHFAPEAFERNLQFEMGLSSRNPTKLLPSAFPTLTTAPAEANERQKRMESRSKKEMLTTILKNTAAVEVIQEDEVREARQTAGEEVIDEKDEKILHLETEIQRLNSVVSTLNKCKNEQLAEIKRLKISIKTTEFQRNNLEQKLSCIFTNGQQLCCESIKTKRRKQTTQLERKRHSYVDHAIFNEPESVQTLKEKQLSFTRCAHSAMVVKENWG